MKPSKHSETRRLFLQRSIAVGAAGMAPLVYRLEAMAAAGAQNVEPRILTKAADATIDIAAQNPNYKALVCMFMYGGNDNANFIIPYDQAEYDTYATARTVLAIPRTGDPTSATVNSRGLIPLGALASQGGRTLAFHPNVGRNNVVDPALFRSDGLPALWDTGKLAIVGNVGPLVVPLTKIEYTNKTKARPQNLFSHSDQVATWMTSASAGYASTGVGGRIADLVDSMNVPPAGQPKIATCISISGVNKYQTADFAQSYQINSSGPVGLSPIQFFNYASSSNTAINGAINAAFTDQTTRLRSNYFETQWGGMMNYSLQTRTAINAALAANPLPAALIFRTTNNSLSSQLKMVAKLVAASTQLGMVRQIFFVQIGGFDTHGSEFHPQNNANWNKISEAVYDFQQAMNGINAANQVTLFSASDFGRTLDSNGGGTDHGWGGHHFVAGGAVHGGDLYGTFPTVALGTSTDINRGALLPTTSIDQFHGTLATWFGVSNSDLATVVPNLSNFTTKNLGFV